MVILVGNGVCGVYVAAGAVLDWTLYEWKSALRTDYGPAFFDDILSILNACITNLGAMATQFAMFHMPLQWKWRFAS